MPENVALTTVHNCGFELLSKQSYSPIRHLKESLRGRAFEDNEAIITPAVNEWTEECCQNFFLESVTKNSRTEMGNLHCSPAKLC